jgi:L,D-peptidoglycan transpeptidase YkuD (ErfK/YbiS/YcfS/YnhG family)
MGSALLGRSSTRSLALALLVGVLLAGCSGAASSSRSRPIRPASARSAPTFSSSTTATTSPSTSASTPPTTSAASAFVSKLSGVGSAGQLIVVTASGYGGTTALLSAYQRSGDSWQQVFGPWSANLGYNGFAPPGAKREGDGRTPSGSFGIDFFFGVDPNPGVRYPYRLVTGPYLVWDDDPSSPLYNEWVDERSQAAGASPESMDQVPAYDYGAVIDYNPTRVPGAGSAIFLHESTGGSTAGCVSLPTQQLLAVLRWLDPAQSPRIVMGTLATISS